jgi:glyoxylase-like metal-dependent hydrolase (beta-lactamase superfamily II)
MNHNNLALDLVLGASSLGLASQGFGQHAPQRTITHVTGDFYRAQDNNHNSAFLVTPEGIVVVDPLNPQFAEWLKQELGNRFGVPVRYVIYSHHHWDHASGGAVFADTAEFAGHANMLSYLEMPPDSAALSDVIGQYAPVAALDANGNGRVERAEASDNISDAQFLGFDANGNDALSGAEVVRGPVSQVHPPTITYEDELELTLGGQRVVLEWVGEMNHSFDMSRIIFPDESVMMVVDYITFGRLPFREMDYENGMFEEWMAAIRETEEVAKAYEYVTTGHGPLGNWENISEWRVYFETLRERVAAAIAEGQSLEEMRETIRMPEYEHWAGYDWLDENVLGMYHFLTD